MTEKLGRSLAVPKLSQYVAVTVLVVVMRCHSMKARLALFNLVWDKEGGLKGVMCR